MSIPAKSLGPSPGQETLVFHNTPGTQRSTMTSRNADGGTGLNEWEIAYDGQDHPTLSGSATPPRSAGWTPSPSSS